MDADIEKPQGKRYYWLKLQDGFFNSKRIKKLRRLAGGDTYTIIYLKMQLIAMKHDGLLEWTGLEDNFADELALDLDEEPDNVAVTLQYLKSCGLCETSDNIRFFFPYALENVGSEGSSAKRVRDFRKKQTLQCNAPVTGLKRLSNGEKEIEIEKEIEKEKEKEINNTPILDPSIGKGESERENQGRPEMTDQERLEKIRKHSKSIDVHLRFGYPTDGIYYLAAADGITREEIDEYRKTGGTV